MAAVLEVGPVTVRLLGETGDVDAARAEALLYGLDDVAVLVDERPVNVDDLLRIILSDLRFGDEVIVPSWWPQCRIDRIRSAAAAGVRCRHRAEFIAERSGGAPTVVEVDRALVTVSNGVSPLLVLDRRDVEAIAGALSAGGEVLFDVPDGVHGARLRDELTARGIAVHEVDVDGLDIPVAETAGGDVPAAPRRRLAVAAATALAAVAGAAFVRPAGQEASTTVVEGRVAVAVPANWTVQRVTGGPGSRRLQVTAPGDTGAALHITQSYVPETTLSDAVAVLGRVAAAQPPGVFADMAVGVVAGRDAVTYREVRPGRVIRWAVLIDGATRIGVGCQSRPGGQEAIRLPCEAAVASARERP